MQILMHHFSSACSIQVPGIDTVIVTGGLDGSNGVRVQKFSQHGASEQLPDMQQSRLQHACGYYYQSEQLVSENCNIKLIIFVIVAPQVYLVTGGWGSGDLTTTELLVEGSTAWSYSGALPYPKEGLRAATLNNKLIVSTLHYPSPILCHIDFIQL